MGKETEELPDLYCNREARKLCSKIKGKKKQFKPRVNIRKTKDGSIICDQNEALTRWNEHFDELNKNNNQEHAAGEDEDIQPIEGPTVEDTDRPRLKNWKKLLRSLKIIRHWEQMV